MKNFIFDLQRFDGNIVTIPANGTHTLDGVTYTAISNAVLNLDDGKVSGLASGSVTATIAGATNSPTVTFDATDGAVNFTATSNGEVISAKMFLPLEIISGKFTFDGSTLDISANSKLAIVTTTDDYSLRNENTFVYDSSYTFSSTTMTSDSKHVISHFVLSDGTNTRELDLEQLGKVINNFTERGFTLVKGSSEVINIGDYKLTATAVNDDAGLNIALGADGVTLTPNSNDGALNIVLTRGDTEIISGELECTSGEITFGYDHAVTFAANTSFNFTRNGYTLTATSTDKATTDIEFTSTGLSFTPGKDDGGLKLSLSNGTTTLFDGELNVSGGTISFDVNTQKFSFTKGTEVSITLAGENPQEFQFKVVDKDASFKVELVDSGKFKITPDSGDGSLDITIKQDNKTIFYNNISVTSGSIIISDMGQTIGLTSGTSMTVTLGNYTFDITANADASFGLGVLSDGTISITPQDNDGSLDISISRVTSEGTSEIFSNTISISGGSITFNPTTQLMTLTTGTTISLEFNTYKLIATAEGNAASKISFTGSGITIEPQTDDGTLNLTLSSSSSSGSMTANIEVLSGSFTLGDGGAITVTKNTELKIKFSDDYIVNFKASDEAGGTISLGTNGITFKPGSSDGGLQLTVTKNGETRSASLDVTGSVTYKFNGSISLAKGTVVKNVFDDGNILTIEATSDASGSIIFNPQTGLTITPPTTDALTATLTTGKLEVAKFTSIDGSITYSNGIVTATNGTSANLLVYGEWETKLSTTGGTASIQFTDDRTVYTANDGATFVLDYLDGSTVEIQNGSFSDIYETKKSDAIELVSVGSTFRSNDDEFTFTLEKAGTYTLNGMNVTTTEDGVQVQLSDYNTATFAANADVKVSTVEGDKFFTVAPGKKSISFSTKNLDHTQVTGGTVEFDNTTQKFSCTAGTTLKITRDAVVTTLTAPEKVSAAYKVEDSIAYFDLDENSTANISVTSNGQSTFTGNLTAGGVLSYRPDTGTFGLTGANSSHGDGNNTFAQITTDKGYTINLATNNTTVVFVPTISDGKLNLEFPNDAKNAMAFTLGKDGETILERQLIVNGTVGIDIASQELSLTQDTVLSLSPDGETWLEITALDDASGQIQFTDNGIRFAPNAGDGKLELNFTTNNRKATLDVSAGAIILNNDGTMSLEKDSVVNISWEDGNALTLTASDTGGAIGFDAQGLKVSSDGELSIDLTTAAGVQTTLKELTGSIHYNAGKVLFDENSTLTATSSLGGQPTNITLESNGEGGYVEISANGTNYVAGSGALKVTWSRDDLSSTFSINSGSVFIGHNIFEIAKGTDLSTDLKDLVPALYFTTTNAGTYTINGQTITTTAENISMTATDDYMTFTTSDNAVIYDEMNFVGAGTVSLSSSAVVLGAGVEATGFGKDKMFVLAEAGNVTADARIFELTKIEDVPREIPMIITVTGAQDGFIFSRTLTKESEAYLDDALDEESFESYSSPYIGKVFTEKFIAANDDSYRIRTDAIGLQEVIGISDGVSVTGGAILDGEPTLSYFNLVTDTEGNFTIGERTYNISGDSSVAIRARFEAEAAPYASYFDSLSGTVSGDFTAHEVSINGSSSAVQVYGDTLISIAADNNGYEVLGLDAGASLKVSAADTYKVNSTDIEAQANDIIVGTSNGMAWIQSEYHIDNASPSSLVTASESNDSIINTGEGATVEAIGGDDYIYNTANNVLISGGDGNDTLYNHGDNITIDMGAGNNSISNNSDNVIFIWSGGNDTIDGFKEDSVLQIEGSYSTQKSGSDVIVTVGDKKITLTGAASLDTVLIIDTTPTVIANTANDTLIIGSGGSDSIVNDGSNVTIRTFGGDDTINSTGENVIIEGSDGADIITNYSPTDELTANSVSINAGAGNDTIINKGDDITITGGTGDDLISLSGGSVLLNYAAGNGNDTIFGFDSDDTLSVGDNIYATQVSGDDLIITVGNSKITLIDAASLSNPNIESTNSIVTLMETILKRTALGYPAMAAIAFDPEGKFGDEPTNYKSKEDWSITSADNLKLHAVHYTPKNSNDKWVVLIHGYGNNHKAMYLYATSYLANNYNVLMIDQRAAGESEGVWLTMGTAESQDVALWTQEIARRNSNAKITLHGVSMGSATAMLAASRSDAQNVTALVEDCGYSSVMDIFYLLNDAYVKAPTEAIAAIDPIAAGIMGYYLHDAAPINSISAAQMPTMFITGDADTVVPVTMLSELYDASGAEVKEKFIVKGAPHALAGLNDPVGYSNAVFRFVAEANGEGWDTTNITDDISLRGTKYNDTIVSSGEGVTIDTGEGDDSISNTANNVSISGGDGDDTIKNSGSNVTLSSGSGSDRIVNTGDNVVIEFTGGTDSVWGFNETTELSIAEGSSSIRSGGDIIVSVDDDKIILVGASSLVASNFDDGESIILTKKGEQVVAGEKVFELTKKVSSGVTIASTENGFTSSLTEKDGKVFVEEFIVSGDDSYNVSISGNGLQTISGIDAGTNITSSATLDGENSENQVYIVTEDAGSYTFNDIKITTTKDNAEIYLANDALSFKAADVAEYDGKTFSGDGRVAVSVDSVVLGSSVSAMGFDKGESFILAQKGSTTVDGRVFELTENIPNGISITGANNDYMFSHKITQKDATLNNEPDSYIGKTFSENVIVAGDDDYSLRVDSFGLRRVSGISDGASINGGDTSIDGNSNDKYAQGGQYFYVDTDTEGDFTIGEKTYNISGDSNVELEADFNPIYAYVSGVKNLDGTVSGNFVDDEFYINGNKNPILINGDDSIKVVGSSSGTKLLDVSDGASIVYTGGVKEVHTDTEGEFWIGAEPVPFGVTVTGDDNVTFGFNDKGDLMTVDALEGSIEFSKGTGGALSINGIGIHTRGIDFSSIGAYDNSLYIHDIERGTITSYEPEKVWLQMSGETMTLNGNELTLTADSDGIWLRDKEIVGLDENASLKVSEAGTYTANTIELKAKKGDIIVGLKGNDAYIYNEDNKPITSETSTEELINRFPSAKTEIINSASDVTLTSGGLAIVEATSARVDITASDGTIISSGDNVSINLTGGNTWLFPLEGKMTLEGYDASTGTGFGTSYTKILSAVEDGEIDFNDGNIKFGSSQIYMGKSDELINFYNLAGKQQKVGYATQGDSFDASNETDNLILVAKKSSTVTGGSGDDTILAKGGNFIDGGDGSNLVKMTGEGNSNIVLSGKTTVENFHTGFGTGTDTIYIAGDPAGVEFKSVGLTFGNSSDTVALSDVTTTAKVNIFHENRDVLNKGVFIAPGDWYTVEDSDLAVSAGEEVYFVGTSAKPKVGVDFSGITSDLNVTMDTAYIDSPDYVPTTMWINSVYSLKGGAGNTTIIGSDKSDTILAGSGEQSIYGGAGQDKMYGNTDEDKNVATFFYMPGDGRDSIGNFDFMNDAQDVTADKVKFDDASEITDVFLRGDDVGIRIDGAKDFLMLEDAKGKSFRVNDDLIAKVDTNAKFDAFTNCYVGIGAQASLTVGKGMGNVEVWLSDDSLEYHGTMYDGNFAVLDASQADGKNILAGNEFDNVIIGGTGDNSLWGGVGNSNDLMIGGAAHNDFYYEFGNGTDTISSANDGDIIHLGMTLEQIDSDATQINAGGIFVQFKDGGSLNIEGGTEVIFSFDDGTTVKANRKTQQFE